MILKHNRNGLLLNFHNDKFVTNMKKIRKKYFVIRLLILYVYLRIFINRINNKIEKGNIR